MEIDAVGVSPDQVSDLKSFDEKLKAGFPFLSDVDHSVCEKYGVWEEKNMYGKKSWGVTRSVFLIDQDGKVLGAWYRIKPEETIPRVFAALGA